MSVPLPARYAGSLNAWFVASVILLIALRGPHLSGPLDDPHSWRQCDTAHASLDFARHGIDVLHPTVNWLGGHRVLIFEFPLTEALTAPLHRVFGESPMWDRVVALAFFTLSTFWFYALVREWAGVRVARPATLAYLAVPLAMFFSRSAHVDFAAQAFVHGLLYHGTLAIRRASFPHALAAAMLGVPGALIKAPYLIPALLPIVCLALATRARIGALTYAALTFALPAAAFLVWRRHVNAVNATTPDWTFLPGFYKEVNPWWWYVGSFGQRLAVPSWIKLAKRMVFEVASPLGVLLAAAGLLRTPGAPAAADAGPTPGPRALALAWLAGTLGYLLVFFPLNVLHDYYQIPFVAPCAVLIGLGTIVAVDRLPRVGRVPVGAVAFVAFLLVALVMPRTLGYYRVDWLRVEAGRAIAARVPAGDLIVAVDHGTEFTDPRLLHRADRDGWPIRPGDATPGLLAQLAPLGARWVAWVSEPGILALEPPAFLLGAEVASAPLAHDGRPLGTLHLFDLGRVAGLESAPGGTP